MKTSQVLQGMKFKHNHDLEPSDEYLGDFDTIRHALKDKRLNEQFECYRKESGIRKRWFVRLGLSSLILGFFSLAAAAIQLMLGSSGSTFDRLWALAESCGVLAILLMLWSRWRRDRRKWCKAVFFRERLRQWHFQKFLDGALIGLLPSDRARYDAELRRRWNVFLERMGDGDGMMREFVESTKTDMFFEPTSYDDPALAGMVLSALRMLRVKHQLSYSNYKNDSDTEEPGLSMQEQVTWSESVASVSFAGAILISTLSIAVRFFPGVLDTFNISSSPQTISRIFGGSALLLTVLSTATRAYRSGNTLPDESESYEEYCDVIREVEAAMDDAPSENEALQRLTRLEKESAAELRRFLRMKLRATFLF